MCVCAILLPSAKGWRRGARVLLSLALRFSSLGGPTTNTQTSALGKQFYEVLKAVISAQLAKPPHIATHTHTHKKKMHQYAILPIDRKNI